MTAEGFNELFFKTAVSILLEAQSVTYANLVYLGVKETDSDFSSIWSCMWRDWETAHITETNDSCVETAASTGGSQVQHWDYDFYNWLLVWNRNVHLFCEWDIRQGKNYEIYGQSYSCSSHLVAETMSTMMECVKLHFQTCSFFNRSYTNH